ncbi:putative inorganic carbon transporter subunit DabA [uncultured Caulobacter sp.]|uniref:putative inorganic carbon transporter subunit DabA n=1 Tax=uncultured Caulobacter sp. TaxID=158749 RepID=UPI00262467EA|nr:putative inorganic carbon transporter subunit DabA [uncultured Caulobacter sp.]
MDGNLTLVGLDPAALDWALDAIPPAFPLDATVAVNPVLGFSRLDLGQASALLEKTAGARLTAPRAWYGQKIAGGEITSGDLDEALNDGPGPRTFTGVERLKSAARSDRPAPTPLPLISDLARAPGEADWTAFVTERIATWASAFFDQGQALWGPAREQDAFADWRAFARVDLAPELSGLRKFRAFVGALDPNPRAVIAEIAERLGLRPAAQKAYFLRVLHAMGGWSQLAAHRRWTALRDGRSDATLEGLLAARLAWELYFQARGRGGAPVHSPDLSETYAGAFASDPEAEIDAALHRAYEAAQRRGLSERLTTGAPIAAKPGRPALQAVFCIDVRSEVLRRHLERQDPSIVTLGFAGFFGIGAGFSPGMGEEPEHRLPVLLQPQVHAHACQGDVRRTERARLDARTARAIERFKTGAVAAFAFVESMGLGSVKDLMGARAKPSPAARPVLDASLDQRIALARGALKGMGLDRDFAPTVLIVGHGAKVQNNPHASALQCGACGGHAGDVNALLLAGLLNDAEVRAGLAESGLVIPADTRFFAGLHDTASDAVEWLRAHDHNETDQRSLQQARAWLDAAARAARAERADRRPGAALSSSPGRAARSFAEVRPEWGLAGCHGFIIAPRARTRGLDLDGAVFLHDYDQSQDPDFKGLEAILTAPVVVASWINLAYFGARVAPEIYGGGDKLLHNVVGGVSVGEGGSLTPRPGLPWQSLWGEQDIHPPRRLVVVVDAPAAAVAEILDRHPDLKAWFASGWLTLTTLESSGGLGPRWSPKAKRLGADL